MGCHQVLSLGKTTHRPEEHCEGDKPDVEESCNLQECVYKDTPEIKANLDQDYTQTDPQLKVWAWWTSSNLPNRDVARLKSLQNLVAFREFFGYF